MSGLSLKNIKKEVAELKQTLRQISSSTQSSPMPQYDPITSLSNSYQTQNIVTPTYGTAPQNDYLTQFNQTTIDLNHQISEVQSIKRRLQAIRSDLTEREHRCRHNANTVRNQKSKVREVQAVRTDYQSIDHVIQKEITVIQNLIREIDEAVAQADQAALSLSNRAVNNQTTIEKAIEGIKTTPVDQSVNYQKDPAYDEDISAFFQERYGHQVQSGYRAQDPSLPLKPTESDNFKSELEQLTYNASNVKVHSNYAHIPKNHYKDYYRKGNDE